ncbi:hypothetical protein [Actinoplanes subglobosus]|uniref:Protein kinase domain-containing protein n=1 Tax=Actinoplanes subglobosus TaxID=1547892 RepID=A0ABV8IXX0_9ACTN
MAPDERPTISVAEYVAAVAVPEKAFLDPRLRAATPAAARRGGPLRRIGQNTVVFRLDDARGDSWAVRCFLSPGRLHGKRFRAIAGHLTKQPIPEMPIWDVLRDELLVDGRRVAVLVAPWQEGAPLDVAVAAGRRQPESLRALAFQWADLMRRLERARVAHGDVQHGNVLIDRDRIALVDPDGIWTPTLRQHAAPAEAGHPNYRHPRAGVAQWGPNTDRFAAHVVQLSLLAVAADPSLWDRFHDDNNLIFTEADFAAPGSTPVWEELGRSPDRAVVRFAAVLADLCRADPSSVPTLHSTIKKVNQMTTPAPAPVKEKEPARPAMPLPVPVVWLLAINAIAGFVVVNRDPESGFDTAYPVTVAIGVWLVLFAGILAVRAARPMLTGLVAGFTLMLLALLMPAVAEGRLEEDLVTVGLAMLLAGSAFRALKGWPGLTGEGRRLTFHLGAAGGLAVAATELAVYEWDEHALDRYSDDWMTGGVIGLAVLALVVWLGPGQGRAGWALGMALAAAIRPTHVSYFYLEPWDMRDPWSTAVPLFRLVGIALLLGAAGVVAVNRLRRPVNRPRG